MARPTGSADTATRRRITDLLKRGGSATASELADELAVSAVAVRQHLQALEDEGLVDYTEVAEGRGRPSRHWSLSDEADRVFPDAHAELAVGLLAAMQRSFGDDGVRTLMRSRGREQVKAYRRRMPEDADLAARVERLAELRSEEGYMAEAAVDEDGALLLIEHHCPVCAAATQCQGLCRAELHIFRRVLGRDAQIERTEHLLSGGRRCVYRIRQR